MAEASRREKNGIIEGCCLFTSHIKLFDETGQNFKQEVPRKVVIWVSVVVTLGCLLKGLSPISFSLPRHTSMTISLR